MKNNKLITKSNELNEARYKLTLLEQKVILSVLTKIQPDDVDFKVYRFTVKELIKLLDLKGQGLYSDLKRVTRELKNKELVIINAEKKTELITNWFSSVKYFHTEGYIQFRFDPELKPYLLQLKERFVSYHLKDIVQLKSSYSIRIYELLKQYEKVGSRTFEITDLKKILGINKNEYQRYTHFKSRVILSAQKEIPEKTDIEFTFNEIKQGREVNSINFIIKKKSNTKKKDNSNENKQIENSSEINDLISLMPEEHKEKKTILDLMIKYLKRFDLDYVTRNIKYSNKHCQSNYRVFLLKSLKDDWGLELHEDLEAKKKIELVEKEKKRLEKEKRQIEEDLNKKIDKIIDQNKDELRIEALKRLDKDLQKKVLKNDVLGRFALTGMIREVASERVITN